MNVFCFYFFNIVDRRFISSIVWSFTGKFDEATDGHQVLATHDRHNQRVRWHGHFVDRGQGATVSAQSDFQQTRRHRGERWRDLGQRHYCRWTDQQQQDDHDADGTKLNAFNVVHTRDAANRKAQQRRYIEPGRSDNRSCLGNFIPLFG